MRSVVVFATLAILLASSTAGAATFAVTTNADSGAGSLRQAIVDANAAAGADTITVTIQGSITLATALPSISGPLTITGPGAANLTVTRSTDPTAPQFRIFSASAALAISGITIAHGATGSFDSGAGVRVDSGGSLELTDAVLTGNSSDGDQGAAIYAGFGAVTLTRTRLTSNTGLTTLTAAGIVNITDSTISGNTGVALHLEGGPGVYTVERTTVSGNTNANGAAGLQLQGGSATFRNCTFSGNTGTQAGDFWMYSSGTTLTLINVTSNTSSLALNHEQVGTTVIMKNTVFAGSGARCSLNGHAITSQGGNLAQDASCGLNGTGDKQSMDPQLLALASNGGPTETHRFAVTSPLLNGGTNSSAPAVDQRGLARPAFVTTDIGALEAQPPAAPAIGSATPGDGNATIAFGAPTSGDGTIAGYVVTCNPGAVTASGTTTEISVANLANDTPYTCSVTATNEYGVGPSSATVAVTPVRKVLDAGSDAASGEDDAGRSPDSGSPNADAGSSAPVDSGIGGPLVIPSGGGNDDGGCSLVAVSTNPYPFAALAALASLMLARRRRRQ